MYSEAKPTILIVDDNPQIRSFIRPALEDSGFKCIEAVDGEEAVYQVEESRPDLIVLDIELGDPDMDGMDVCKRIRSLGYNVPVIFLTVRNTIEDLSHGLQVAGPGGDYVKKLEELRQLQVESDDQGNLQIALKSHDTRELIERIKTRLPTDIQGLGPDLRITRRQRSVERLTNGEWEQVHLAPLEYETLKTLVDANGAVVGSWDLFDRVFQGGRRGKNDSEDSEADDYKKRVYVCINFLRNKIDPQRQHNQIKTVHGIGYRFSTTGSK